MSLALAAALLVLPAAAAPGPRPVFELDPRLELLSAALLLADPGSAAAFESDEYARAARAALQAEAGHPAVARLSALLAREGARERLARAVLEPPAARDAETAAALAALEALGRRRRFGAFLAGQKAAHEAFVRAARAEELDAISPAAAARYLGRPFEGTHRFVLAPLLPAGRASWRAAGGWVHLRPRSPARDGRLGFRLDTFEGSAAHALVLAELERVAPATARMREQLAFAVGARLIGLDLGRASYTAMLQRPSLRGYTRLRETAESLGAYEASRASASLEAYLPRSLPLARMRLDEAASEARSGRAEPARAFAAAALQAPLGPDELRRAAAILADLGEFPLARSALDRLAAAGTSDARLSLEVAFSAARAGARADALELLARARGLPAAPAREVAEVYLELGEARTALAQLEAVVAASPRDAAALVSLAEAAAASGEAEKAARALAAAASLEPGPDLRRRMAWARWRIKDRAGAAALLDALIEESPRAAAPLVDRAALASAAQERTRALKLLEAARGLDPDARSRERIAQIYADLGRRERREPLGEPAGRTTPGEPARLARYYAALDAYDSALGPLEDMIRASPADPRLRVEHAFTAAKAGDFAKARASLEAARGLGLDEESRRRAASALSLIGERDRAAELLDEAIARWPADPDARVDRAALAAETDAPAALKLLASAGRLAPGPAARWSMFQVYRRLGETDQARALIDALLAEEPDEPRLVLGSAALDAQLGRRAQALDSLARAERLELEADELRELALLYLELGDRRRALGLLERRAAAVPADAGLRIELARAAARAGERETALRALAAAERAARPPMLAEIARIYGDLDEPRRALPPIEALLRASPADPDLLLAKAEAAARAGLRGAALEALGRARPLVSDRGRRRRMAIIHQDLKDYGAARELLRALLAESGEPAVLADLGVCEQLSGRTDEAVASLKEALAREPGLLAARLTLGAIYGRLGRRDEELDVYRLAPRTGGDPALRALLEEARARTEAAVRR